MHNPDPGAQLIYEALGPAAADPAALELMRGIWEKSLLVQWVLDPDLTSRERLGRMKGWLAESLRAAGRGPWALDQYTLNDMQTILDECPEPTLGLPKFVDLSARFDQDNGEGTYRLLNAVLHGDPWSSSVAQAREAQEGGFLVRWQGFPIDTHEKLMPPVICCADAATEVAAAYFTAPATGRHPST